MCIGNHFNRITVGTHMNIHKNSDEKNFCGKRFAYKKSEQFILCQFL